MPTCHLAVAIVELPFGFPRTEIPLSYIEHNVNICALSRLGGGYAHSRFQHVFRACCSNLGMRECNLGDPAQTLGEVWEWKVTVSVDRLAAVTAPIPIPN